MHKLLIALFSSVLTTMAFTGCGPGVSGNDDGGGGGDDGGGSLCDDCAAQDMICVPDIGCVNCVPDTDYCNGPDDDQVWHCDEDGMGGSFVEQCGAVCHNGFCLTPCERADQIPSNVGCHFYAVDLDNEAYHMDIGGVPMDGDAASMQYAVVLANNDPDLDVTAQVFKNSAPFGQPVNEVLVTTVTVPANDIKEIDLPQREVDGSMGQNGTYVKNSGSGTFVSSHAYRIETDGPVVAYQFNPIEQAFTNDASILIPSQALGKDYYILGFPTANPCGNPMLEMDSIPDHTAVTIVGTEENTFVTVTLAHAVTASAGDSGLEIPLTEAGNTVEVEIGPYDVVNLESEQKSSMNPLDCVDYDGDFTGTKIVSNNPIVVFSNQERGLGTGGANPPDPPNFEDDCCTEHFEQQMFPTTALGWKFAISRSPVRSTTTYVEPDIYRILATKDGTVVHTSLPDPFDEFTLSAGEYAPFYAFTGFTVESDEEHAIMVGQYLVSMGRTDGGIGDPTFTVFPAAQQHRKDYVFLVPPTWEDNFFVLAMQEGSIIKVDGQALDEFNDCVTGPIGTIDGVIYAQLTCPISEGSHTVSSDKPVGLTVYGYYSVGSYGYPGGSDVKMINPIE